MERSFSKLAASGIATIFILFGCFIVYFFSSTDCSFASEKNSSLVIAAADEKIQTLDEVVVTASRFEEKVSNVPANVTVITEDMIKNSTAVNIPELLRSQAGINVSDFAGNRRYYNVDLRGYGETGGLNTLVLVDGRRVNSPDLSGVDWSQIPLENIQKIEIVRGGRGAVLYGDNASGGVINIITKEGDKLKAGAEVAAGSYSSYGASAFVGGIPYGVLPFYALGSYKRSDGYRDNSGIDMKDVGVNMSYIGVRNMKINFAFGYHQDYNRMPGALKESDFNSGASRTSTKYPNDFAKVEDYYFRLTPEYLIAGEASLKMDVSYRHRTNDTYTSGDVWNFRAVTGIGVFALAPRLVLKNELSSNISNVLTVGFDYSTSQEDIKNRSDYMGWITFGNYNLRKDTYGFYAHDEITIAKNLIISAGYRGDQAHYSFSPGFPDNATMRASAWTAGVNYKYMGRSYAYVSYSRSFRYPALDEYFNFMYNTVNTSLKLQTSDSYEIGTRFYFTKDIYAHLNLFRSDTRNELFYNPYTYENINLDGKSRRQGVELSFSAKLLDPLTVRGNYTYIASNIRGGSFNGKRIPNTPEHKFGVEGQYSPFKGFTIALSGVYVGERPFISDFANDYSNQKSYFLLNNRYSYRWKNYTVFLNINNLLNQKYSEYGVVGGYPIEKAYYPSPGVNFYGGLKVEI